MSLRLGSLFSGVGGFDLAAERVGMTVAWQSEIEPFACKVLAHRFPDVPNLGDVTLIEDAPHVDVITFGSPCQDLSVAGKRAGMEGERSGLFFEAIRIIERVRPEFAIWENVPGALSSHQGRDFARCLDALADIGALDIAWRVLDARFFGVPQRRRRVFLVCDFAGERAASVLALTEGGAGHPPPRRAPREAPAYALAASVRGTGDGHGNAWNTTYAIAENFTALRVTDTAPSLTTVGYKPTQNAGGMLVAPCDTGRYGKGTDSDASDALIFDQQNSGVVEQMGTLQAEGMARQNRGFILFEDPRRYDTNGIHGGEIVKDVAPSLESTNPKMLVATALTASNGHHGHSRPRGDGGDNLVLSFDPRQITSPDHRTRVDTGLSPCLADNGPSEQVTIAGMGGVRRLAPVECERLMSLADGHTCLCGVWDQYAHLADTLPPDERAHLNARVDARNPAAFAALGFWGAGYPHGALPGRAPDGLTFACRCDDGPRYRACGNGVVTNVAEWLLGRIARLETP